MRHLYAFLLLACLAPMSWGVASASWDATRVMCVQGATLSLSSTETTVTFTNNGIQDRLVQLQCDQAWGWSDATGAFGTKYPLAASQYQNFRVPVGTWIIYVQASSTTGTLYSQTLAAIKP